jgi:serine/threonine protein kinase
MKLANYVTGRILGQGAYGHIIYGKAEETGEEVAIKFISKQVLQRAKKAQVPITEKECLGRFSTSNVVALKKSFEDRFQHYLVFEYLPNGTLAEFFAHHPSPTSIKRSLAQILLILADIHRHGIIHRDIKPENFMFDSENRIKVIDFGSAKLFSQGQSFSRGSFVGSVDYIAPEILLGVEQTPALDLWAFGCILYRAFCEQPPFYAATKMETYQRIQKLDYSIPDSVPQDATDLIRKLLVDSAVNRLGNCDFEQNYVEIREHPFFADIDWETIASESIERPSPP